MRTRIIVAAVVVISLIAALLVRHRLTQSDLSAQLRGPSVDEAARNPSTTSSVRPTPVKVFPAAATARSLLTPNPADKEMLDATRLADNFDALVQRARREPAFAQSLAFALYQCAIRERNYKLLEKSIPEMTPKQVEDSEALARADFAKCDGLKSDQIDTRIELAEFAATAGVLEAQLNYRSIIGPALRDGKILRTPGLMDRYRRNVEVFAQAAARSDDPRGALLAHDFYSQGIFVPPDYVRAYRYAQQYARLKPGPAAQLGIDQLVQRMSPEELRRARGY